MTWIPCRSSRPCSRRPSAGRHSKVGVVLSAHLLAPVEAGLGRHDGRSHLWKELDSCCWRWRQGAWAAWGSWAAVSPSAVRRLSLNVEWRTVDACKCWIFSLRLPVQRCWGQGCCWLVLCIRIQILLLEKLSKQNKTLPFKYEPIFRQYFALFKVHVGTYIYYEELTCFWLDYFSKFESPLQSFPTWLVSARSHHSCWMNSHQ